MSSGVQAKTEVRLSWQPLVLWCQMLLGVVFIVAGATKLAHVTDIAGVLPFLAILPAELVQSISIALPCLEIAIGLLLVLNLYRRAGVYIGLALIAGFVVANAYGIAHGLSIGSGEMWASCQCFGSLIPLNHYQSLAIDFVMVGLALPVLFNKRGNRHGNV